jgi:hypothetical protein
MKNSKLVDKLIRLGYKDADAAAKAIAHYLKTGILK